MSLYSFILFVHVLSAIGFFVALALEAFVSLRISWAQDADEMRFFVMAFERLKWIAIPSFAGILLGGLYLAYPYGSTTFWIPAALAATLAIMAIGGFISGRRRIQLRKALAKPDAAFGVLSALARSNSLTVSYGLRVGLAFAIVFLMTTQPDVWLSVAALVAGAVGGLLIAWGFQRISQRGTTGCGAAWRQPLEQSPEHSAQ